MTHKLFIIIHPSAIVKTGLKTILNKYFNLDILLLNKTEELTEYKISGTMIILFTDVKENSAHVLSQLHPSNKVITIGLLDDDGEPSTHYDHLLPWDIPPGGLQQMINGILQQTPAIQKESEGELTTREKAVLKEVALGLTNKEIAEKLHISIHTVITHRKNITAKLDIKTISGLTVYAILNKLIDTDTINPEDLI